MPFSNGCLLFDELKQSVLILSQTATFIYCASFEVNSYDELVILLAEQFSISRQQAQKDIDQFYHYIEENSFLLEDTNKQNSFLNVIETPIDCCCNNTFDALYFSVHQNTFSVNLPTHTLKNELSAIYTYFIASFHYNPDNNIKYVIHICLMDTVSTRFSIYINKQCVAQNLLLENVVPYVFGIIFETTWRTELNPLENQERLDEEEASLMFHAAVLAKDNHAILFPAESGAGKSTLSAVLAHQGWDFFTDELAIIKPKKNIVKPCPLSVCVKEGAVDFLSFYYPQLKNMTLHHRLDNKKVRYLPVVKSQLVLAYKKITVIIFPLYNKKIPCEVHILEKEEALMRFLMCGSSGRPINKHELSAIARLVEQTPCYSLVYSNIEYALEEISSIMNQYH